MVSINISHIEKGMPGITPAIGAVLVENCVVMLHESGHTSPANTQLSGLLEQDTMLLWDDRYTEQVARAHADTQETTELAAVCVSVVLAKELTGYTIIERSRKGTGYDYLLGDDTDMFVPKARLEISGIARETQANTVEGRFRQKTAQITASDATNLPAYISVVEFCNPKILFNQK